MSQALFAHDNLFLQRFLKSCGLYAGPLDSQFNINVGNCEDALAAQYEAIKLQMGNFDARSGGLHYDSSTECATEGAGISQGGKVSALYL